MTFLYRTFRPGGEEATKWCPEGYPLLDLDQVDPDGTSP